MGTYNLGENEFKTSLLLLEILGYFLARTGKNEVGVERTAVTVFSCDN